MVKLILVRHGESEMNKKGVHQGQIYDTSLSKEGLKQVRELAQRIKNEGIKKIYSSDLKRAYETAQILGDVLNVDVVGDPKLREFTMGHFDKNPNQREELFKEFYKKEIKKGKSKYEIRPKNGENIWDFLKRINSFLNEMLTQDGTILVVTHGGVIENILNLIEGRDKEKEDFRRYYHDNTAITEVINLNGKWKIVKINESGHLKQIKPKKILYKDQERIYAEAKLVILEKIQPEAKEAYIFGSLLKREIGKYLKPFGRHIGSNIDVLVVMEKEKAPLRWKYVKEEDLFTIYEAGKIIINGNKHRIDFYLVEDKNVALTIKKVSDLGLKPEKIK